MIPSIRTVEFIGDEPSGIAPAFCYSVGFAFTQFGRLLKTLFLFASASDLGDSLSGW